MTVSSLRRAYGSGLKRNVQTDWVHAKREHDFVAWCRQDADLVYKKDCYDYNDGLYHKAGDRVTLDISNFDFSSYAYALYQFDPKAR